MESQCETIEVGEGYKLYPVMNGLPSRLCYVSGRQGNAITVLMIDEIITAEVQAYDREFARVKTRVGDYNLLPCNLVTDVQDVAEVCTIRKEGPER